MNNSRTIVFLAMAAVALPAFGGATCRATSDAMTRPLVELYTSEGCNSCPPAERWLASNFPMSATNAVALAFHVDYWDRLGWTDRFANAHYTERQYTAMRANGASFVYTPQVLLQGRDLPAWQQAGKATIEAAARTPARATLALEATLSGNTMEVRGEARISDPALHSGAQLFVGYADSGLHSDVKAGENRGVRLRHDHVVRALDVAGVPDARGVIYVNVALARPREFGTDPTLVAFVQRSGNGDVLQSLALPLAACADNAQRATTTTR
jgi:hypothetical protein